MKFDAGIGRFASAAAMGVLIITKRVWHNYIAPTTANWVKNNDVVEVYFLFTLLLTFESRAFQRDQPHIPVTASRFQITDPSILKTLHSPSI